MTCFFPIGLRRRLARIAAVITWAAIVPLFAGCGGSNYELEMTVEGETLHRELVCWHEVGSEEPPNLQQMPDGELQRIATAFGVPIPDNNEQKFEFSGEFQARTPDDVGGAGTLTMFEADMGRTWMYVERFRGEDELTTTLAARRQAVDDLSDALSVWLQAELRGSADLDRVRAFLQGPLRDDLHDVATYFWLGAAFEDSGLPDTSGIDFEMLVRLGQFGLERDYLRPSDLPQLVQIANGQDGVALVRTVRTMLSVKLGPDVDVDDWTFLNDPVRLTASINDGLRDHPPYEAFRAAWRDQNPDQDRANAPQPAQFVGDLAAKAIGLDFSPSDSLSVTLQCPVCPFRTNGDWAVEEGHVAWNESLAPHPDHAESPQRVLPAVLFAFWSVPDEDAQTRHFGRIVLEDEPLAQYAMWRSALPAQEAAEWDTFMAELRPSADLRERIETFRFASDPPIDAEGDEEGTVLSERGRDLILKGLNDES